MIPVSAIIRLNCGRDRNGNSRACYVALAPSGGVAGAWDCGPEGFAAVPAELRELARRADLHPFLSSALERRELLAAHVRNGRAHGAAEVPPLRYVPAEELPR